MSSPDVIIVENDPKSSDLIKHILENEGYKTILFSDGLSMIEALPKMMPVSLFIIDVIQPNINGFELCQYLKNVPRWESIPVIFLSTPSSEENKVRGLMIGADDYITKPFSILEFLARVEAVLRRYGRINSKDRNIH